MKTRGDGSLCYARGAVPSGRVAKALEKHGVFKGFNLSGYPFFVESRGGQRIITVKTAIDFYVLDVKRTQISCTEID